MNAMNAVPTARQRARAELTREITDEARRQLAVSGPVGLSLRAVARELGMVSSALYRYFPSRDDLLTALIIDAYNALGEAAETADREVEAGRHRDRLRAVCHAVRGWAVAHPSEYALVYGSPVPGYRAPEATVVPGVRVPLVLLQIVGEAWKAGVLPTYEGGGEGEDEGGGEGGGDGDGERAAKRAAERLTPVLEAQTAGVAEIAAPGMPGVHVARGAMVWTQLFGMLNFELFGQFVGSMDPADEFFAYAVERMADFLGLPPDPDS